MSNLSGAASVIANARSSAGFGRAAGFLNEVAKARQNRREPAQHVLAAPHPGSPPEHVKPFRSGPSGDIGGLDVDPLEP